MSESSTNRVATFVAEHELDAEIISTPGGVPTVESAAQALGVSVDQILKTLVFVDSNDRTVICIAAGTGRIDRARLSEVAGTGRLKLAPATLVIEKTGYAPGGVAPFDLPSEIPVVVDEAAARQVEVYGGSGTDVHMIRVRMDDVIRLNDAIVAPILQGLDR